MILVISCQGTGAGEASSEHDLPVFVILQHIAHEVVFALIDTPGHPPLGASHRKPKLFLPGLRKCGIAVVVKGQLVERVWKAVQHPLQIAILERPEDINHPWLKSKQS